jgi:hypothetical protein
MVRTDYPRLTSVLKLGGVHTRIGALKTSLQREHSGAGKWGRVMIVCLRFCAGGLLILGDFYLWKVCIKHTFLSLSRAVLLASLLSERLAF